jgi:predicted kinase
VQSQPLLIALKGHPGSGKSAIARALGRRLCIPVIDKDDIKDILDGACENAGGLAYAAMFNVARRQLLQGLSVICDSPLSEVAGYTAAQCIAHDAVAQLLVIECVCSAADEWRRRIEQRAALRLPDHHITSWKALQGHMRRRGMSSRYAIDSPYICVDTIVPIDHVVDTIVGWLRSSGYAYGHTPRVLSDAQASTHPGRTVSLSLNDASRESRAE